MGVPLLLHPDTGRHFVPYPKQRRILEDPALTVVATGGVGFGKTVTSAAKVLAEAYLTPGTYLVGAPTYGQLRDTLWMTMTRMVNPAFVVRVNHSARPSLTIRTKNGQISQILGRSLSDAGPLRGLNLSGAAIDEATLCNPEAVDEVKSRLRQQRTGRNWLFITTNPAGRNWFWTWFIAPLEEIEDENERARARGWRQDLAVYNVTSFENPYLYQDFLSPDGSRVLNPRPRISRFLWDRWHSLTPQGRKRWMLGSFEDFSGEVYSAFDPDRHVVPMPAEWRGEIPKHFELIQGADFGFHPDPWATVTVAVEPRFDPRFPKRRLPPRYWVVGEHYELARGLEHHAARMREIEFGRKISVRFTDHEAMVRHELQKALQRAGSSNPICSPAIKGTIEVRIDFINRLFLHDRLRILQGAAPNLVRELRTRDYDPKTRRPVDRDNHMTDALEYALFSYEETQGGRIGVGR